MKEQVRVKVTVADRNYPMVASPDEEEILRATGRKINELIKNFEEKYSVKDKQDALAMCALQYVAKDLARQKEQSEVDAKLNQNLESLTQEILQNL
uniref:cell division protein ZapA n=1 Tax=Ornithobacterium rhinotracheale TaxID=28251 RepID=UPI00288BFC61|nr:cell division protein ZapA [Ornithobacterium rhinotracheale]